MHKFEKLEVWRLAIEYTDHCYGIAEQLPVREEYNLSSQLRRAAVSIALNIAEGSTGQTNPEQARFLGLALRSLIETVACLHLIHRRTYLEDNHVLRAVYRLSDDLAAKLQSMRRVLRESHAISEDAADYLVDSEDSADYLVDEATPSDEARP